MLTHSSPFASADNVADYVNANVASFPEHLKARALEAVREVSPVVRLVKGMELLYAVTQDGEAPERETAINALGSAAMQVAEGGFWGKQDRALGIVKFVRVELNEWPFGVPAPEFPAVDGEYLAPVAAVAPPVSPPDPPEAPESDPPAP